jgi:hypothetical protein
MKVERSDHIDLAIAFACMAIESIVGDSLALRHLTSDIYRRRQHA